MPTAIAPQQVPRLVLFLFGIQFVSMGAMEMSGPFWPLHLRGLAHSEFELALASAAVYVGPMLGIALTSTFWGRIGDRFGHKPMMIRALLGLAVTQLALAFASDTASVLALRFLQGACAGYIAPAQAYGVAVVPAERRGRLFALLQVSTNLGSLAGAVAGGCILDRANFTWVNLGAAVLCGASALAVALALPHVPLPAAASQASTRARSAPSAWRHPAIAGLLATLALLLASRMLTQAPFALYVTTVFQAPNWLVGLCYGLLALGFVLSASAWARHFEHRGTPDALARIGQVALACTALTALAGTTRSITLFALLHLLWGMLLGATTPVLTSLISRATPPDGQGHVLGVTQSVSQFSSIAAIAVGGLLSQSAGLHAIYFFVALSYSAGAAAIWMVRREHRHEQVAPIPEENR